MNDGSLLAISCDGGSSWAIGSGAGTGDNIIKCWNSEINYECWLYLWAGAMCVSSFEHDLLRDWLEWIFQRFLTCNGLKVSTHLPVN